MELKKATNIKIDYPSRDSIKPILAGVGMVLTLSACTQTVTQEPIVKENPKNNIEESENVAGGMPVYIPPIKKFKKSKEKIIPPRVTVGVPVPKSK